MLKEFVAFEQHKLLIFAEVVDEENGAIRVKEICAIGEGGWSDNREGEEQVLPKSSLRYLADDYRDGTDDYAGFELDLDGTVQYEDPSEDPDPSGTHYGRNE